MSLDLDPLPFDLKRDRLRGTRSSLILEPLLVFLCSVDSHGELQRSIQAVATTARAIATAPFRAEKLHKNARHMLHKTT